MSEFAHDEPYYRARPRARAPPRLRLPRRRVRARISWSSSRRFASETASSWRSDAGADCSRATSSTPATACSPPTPRPRCSSWRATTAPGAEGFARLTLPDDPCPPADAIVGIGHPLNYLPTREAIERALVVLARALRPGGVFATDLVDYEWGTARADVHEQSRLGDDWAIITRYENPTPDSHVRDMTTFVRNDDGTWRRDDERHDNVLLDITSVPAVLAARGCRRGAAALVRCARAARGSLRAIVRNPPS